MPKTLSSDKKLQAIFQPTDTEAQIARKIKKGYLKGRAITMIVDGLSNPTAKVVFAVDADNKINSNITVRKLSRTPFFLRRLVHYIRMKCSSQYKNDFTQKAHVLAQGYLAAMKSSKSDSIIKPKPDPVKPEPKPDPVKPEPKPDPVKPEPKPDPVKPEPKADPVKPEPKPDPAPATIGQDLDTLLLFEETPFKFSKKAFEPKAQVQKFQGSLISVTELGNLLNKHDAVLREGNAGTHGDPCHNIISAFKDGTGNTKLGGPGPLIENDEKLNQKLQLQMKQMMTLISQKNTSEQARWIRRLTSPFKSCNAGRVQTIQQVHSELLSPSAGFEGELEQKLQSFKISLMERMLLERYPNQDPSMTPIHLQLPHLTTGYLAEAGKDLGLEGCETAATDKHKYNLSFQEKNQFIADFKNRLHNDFEEFCMGVVTDINNQESGEGISRLSYNKWYTEKVLNNDLSEEFSLYDEKKKVFYEKLNPPSDDQDSLIYNYIAPAELKQILSMLGYLEQAF